jgi:hypothetical protein
MKYCTAGFEIMDISDEDRRVLRKFVESLSIVKSGRLYNEDYMKEQRVDAPIVLSRAAVVDDREPLVSTSATEAAPCLPSWFDEEAIKAFQDIYRKGALQEMLAWWEARDSRLEMAGSVRVVLIELAESLAQALKDEVELN